MQFIDSRAALAVSGRGTIVHANSKRTESLPPQVTLPVRKNASAIRSVSSTSISIVSPGRMIRLNRTSFIRVATGTRLSPAIWLAEKHRAGLHRRFTKQYARHDRIIGIMPGEKVFVAGESLAANDSLVATARRSRRSIGTVRGAESRL